MRLFSLFFAALVAACCAIGVWAQEATEPRMTPQGAPESFGIPPDLPRSELDRSELTVEELERLALFERSRLPDGATFEDFVARFLEPRPYPRESVIKLDDRYAHPHKATPWKMEIVKEEGDTIWLRSLPPEDPESILHGLWLAHEEAQIRIQDVMAFREKRDFFLDFETEAVPPPSVDSLHFQELKTELPAHGRWQMNFAAIDIDSDGLTDLVFPPSRLGTSRPLIFRGQAGGGFAYWGETRWDARVPWDYGGVASGDFDGDGHQDLVFALHFKGQYVVYGDGAGGFLRSERLPSPDPRVTSRALAVADFDGDGRLDVACLAEINFDQGDGAFLGGATSLWVVLNRSTGWEVYRDGLPNIVIGDNVETTDLNGDGHPDLLLSSNTSNWRSLAYLNRGEDGWEVAVGWGVLSRAFHFQVVEEPGEDTRRAAFAVFSQFYADGSENRVRTGIIRYPWSDGGFSAHGTPVVIAEEPTNPYFRIAVGDLNGDGLNDLVAGRKQGGLEVFVQIAPGEFYLERSAEIPLTGRPFHIRLLDVDGDGRDDILAAFATAQDLPGGVRVWLTRESA